MRISFSPQRRDDKLSVSKAGDVLTINGEVFDFSIIPEGADLPAEAVACDFVVGTLQRTGGSLHLQLLLPHGPHPSSAVAFPVDLVEPPDGMLAIPFDLVAEKEIDDE